VVKGALPSDVKLVSRWLAGDLPAVRLRTFSRDRFARRRRGIFDADDGAGQEVLQRAPAAIE
jgi:hypothetical protein